MHTDLDDRVFSQQVQVNFETRVHFTRGLFNSGNAVLTQVLTRTGKQRAKLLAVIEKEVTTHHPDLVKDMVGYANLHEIELVAAPIVIDGGEAIKHSFDAVHRTAEAINAHHIDRHSYVMAIGGGAFLDAIGFAAAIAHRGVRLIRVPTTVLAQNDSGVGVKNAINYFGKKNWMGAFAPPHAVLNDVEFLETLPDREWRAGMAEAVKIALIRDEAFFRQLEISAAALVGRSAEAMRELIHRCALGHMAHIREGGDAFEMGSARPLDHGHWSAHKLEAISKWEIRHGEAVAIGLALDAIYARRMGYLQPAACNRILDLLTALGFDLWVPQLAARNAEGQMLIIIGLDEFREHLGGKLTITLLADIGRGFEVHEMDTDVIAASLMELQQMALVEAA